jgi:hypothetical protein
MSESMKQTPRSCPVEATMIAVLDIIVGLLLVLISVPLGFLDLGLAGERIPAVLDALAGFALGLAACIGLATLVVAWGLWKLKPWAFWVHRLQLCTRDATEQAEREELALVRRLQFVRWLVRTGKLTEQTVRKGEPAEEHEGSLEPVEEISPGSLQP